MRRAPGATTARSRSMFATVIRYRRLPNLSALYTCSPVEPGPTPVTSTPISFSAPSPVLLYAPTCPSATPPCSSLRHPPCRPLAPEERDAAWIEPERGEAALERDVVVRNPALLPAARRAVEERIRRPRVPVARLPDRARVRDDARAGA